MVSVDGSISLLLFLAITITRQVTCQHYLQLLHENEDHVRVRRLIGAVATSAASEITITAPDNDRTSASTSTEDGPNYYQSHHPRTRTFDYDNTAGAGNDDDDSSSSSDEDDDNEINLSSQEIRELVEQNIIQNSMAKNGKGGAGAGTRRKHHGPPPFVNTLQSSSQEEFIVRTDADATAATAIASGGTGRDKVILVPASTVTTKTKTTTTAGKKGDKRRKSSSSGYLLSNAQHQHRQILGLGPELPEAGTGKFHHEKTKCICDTRDCVSNEMALEPTICSTHGMCYTQLLERGDGSTSITKGCISGETPLLCENRLPSSSLLRNKRWPYLVCCKSHLCNAGDLTTTTRKPTTTTTFKSKGGGGGFLSSNFSVTSARTFSPAVLNATAAVTIPDLFDPDDDSETDEDLVNSINGTLIVNATTSDKNRTEVLASSSSPVSSRFISPLASAFLIGGAVLIVLVSAVGFWILKKEQQRLARRYYHKTETDGQGECEPDLEQQQGEEGTLNDHDYDDHENDTESHTHADERNESSKSSSSKTKPLLPKKSTSKSKSKNAKTTVTVADLNGHYKKSDLDVHCRDSANAAATAEEMKLGGNELNSDSNSNANAYASATSSSIPAVPSASSLSLLRVPSPSHSSNRQHLAKKGGHGNGKKTTTVL